MCYNRSIRLFFVQEKSQKAPYFYAFRGEIETVYNFEDFFREFDNIRTYYPEIRDWNLFFEEKHGLNNRDKVLRAFIEFWKNDLYVELIVPGKVILEGNIFGNKEYEDGSQIITSYIRKIEKVENGYNTYGIPYKLFRAYTTSKNQYYFYTDSPGPYTLLLLSDQISEGFLNTRPGYYLDYHHRGQGFL